MGSFSASARRRNPFLQNLTERVIHESAIHGAVQQALCDDRLVAERPELYFIPLRYQAPVVEHQHCENPSASAQTVDAETLPSQFCWAFDFWIRYEVARELINKASHEHQ